MLDLPVLFPALPLAALKPTTTGPDIGAAPAPSAPATAGPAAPVVGPAAVSAPTTGPAAGTLTSTAGTATTGTAGTQPTAEAGAKSSSSGGMLQMLLIGGMFVLLYFVMFRPQKKAEKNRKNLLSAMKKGDRVMTIGGLVARVVSIDDEDVVLKIDESANVKATFKKSSIQQILDRDEKSK